MSSHRNNPVQSTGPRFANKNLNHAAKSMTSAAGTAQYTRGNMLVISGTRNVKTVGSATAPTPKNIPSHQREGRAGESSHGYVSLGYNSGNTGSSDCRSNEESHGASSASTSVSSSARPAPWAKSSSDSVSQANPSAAPSTAPTTTTTVEPPTVSKVPTARMKSWADEDSSDEENAGGMPPVKIPPPQQASQAAPMQQKPREQSVVQPAAWNNTTASSQTQVPSSAVNNNQYNHSGGRDEHAARSNMRNDVRPSSSDIFGHGAPRAATFTGPYRENRPDRHDDLQWGRREPGNAGYREQGNAGYRDRMPQSAPMHATRSLSQPVDEERAFVEAARRDRERLLQEQSQLQQQKQQQQQQQQQQLQQMQQQQMQQQQQLREETRKSSQGEQRSVAPQDQGPADVAASWSRGGPRPVAPVHATERNDHDLHARATGRVAFGRGIQSVSNHPDQIRPTSYQHANEYFADMGPASSNSRLVRTQRSVQGPPAHDSQASVPVKEYERKPRHLFDPNNNAYVEHDDKVVPGSHGAIGSGRPSLASPKIESDVYMWKRNNAPVTTQPTAAAVSPIQRPATAGHKAVLSRPAGGESDHAVGNAVAGPPSTAPGRYEKRNEFPVAANQPRSGYQQRSEQEFVHDRTQNDAEMARIEKQQALKEAREKERTEREPRTKGVLYRCNDKGEIEQVLSPAELKAQADTAQKAKQERESTASSPRQSAAESSVEDVSRVRPGALVPPKPTPSPPPVNVSTPVSSATSFAAVLAGLSGSSPSPTVDVPNNAVSASTSRPRIPSDSDIDVTGIIDALIAGVANAASTSNDNNSSQPKWMSAPIHPSNESRLLRGWTRDSSHIRGNSRFAQSQLAGINMVLNSGAASSLGSTSHNLSNESNAFSSFGFDSPLNSLQPASSVSGPIGRVAISSDASSSEVAAGVSKMEINDQIQNNEASAKRAYAKPAARAGTLIESSRVPRTRPSDVTSNWRKSNPVEGEDADTPSKVPTEWKPRKDPRMPRDPKDKKSRIDRKFNTENTENPEERGQPSGETAETAIQEPTRKQVTNYPSTSTRPVRQPRLPRTGVVTHDNENAASHPADSEPSSNAPGSQVYVPRTRERPMRKGDDSLFPVGLLKNASESSVASTQEPTSYERTRRPREYIKPRVTNYYGPQSTDGISNAASVGDDVIGTADSTVPSFRRGSVSGRGGRGRKSRYDPDRAASAREEGETNQAMSEDRHNADKNPVSGNVEHTRESEEQPRSEEYRGRGRGGRGRGRSQKWRDYSIEGVAHIAADGEGAAPTSITTPTTAPTSDGEPRRLDDSTGGRGRGRGRGGRREVGERAPRSVGGRYQRQSGPPAEPTPSTSSVLPA